MTVPRLTADIKFPLTTFNRCQLCGHEGDICDFQMWLECDEADKPEPGNVIVVCRPEQSPECQKVIDDHPRAYFLVPWGQGEPGWLMLLCGNCPNRTLNGTVCGCKHPHLKANGGDGLLIEFNSPFGNNATVCFHTEDGGHRCVDWFPKPAITCEGHPTEKPTGKAIT
jgi:hypothetical protein